MATEAGEPGLPPLPSPRRRRPRRLQSSNITPYTGADTQSSSDLPLFSSDGHLAELGDVQTGSQRKRRYRGHWWDAGDSGEKPAKKKRVFTRAMDSGIWINDDNLDDDNGWEMPLGTLPDLSLSQQQYPNDNSLAAQLHLHEQQRSLGFASLLPRHLLHADSENDTPEARAQRIVRRCVEDDDQVVDLSCLSLESLPASLLQPLRSIGDYRLVSDNCFDEESYRPLIPNLKIYLSCNSLRSLPLAICSFESLVVLGLRNNQLTCIPPEIGKLHSLVELNVSVNRLEYLPYETLQLFERQERFRLVTHSNPFLEMHEPAWPAGYAHERLPVFLAASPVRYLGVDGAACAGRLRHDNLPGRVPALLELCLRALSKNRYPPLPTESEMEELPGHLARLLTQASFARTSGRRLCSICHRPFVAGRVEWLEWWILNDETVPLLRQGCSGDCVPVVQLPPRHFGVSLDGGAEEEL